MSRTLFQTIAMDDHKRDWQSARVIVDLAEFFNTVYLGDFCYGAPPTQAFYQHPSAIRIKLSPCILTISRCQLELYYLCSGYQ